MNRLRFIRGAGLTRLFFGVMLSLWSVPRETLEMVVNIDTVKRIVALNRQRKALTACVKSGELLQSEADLLIAPIDAEIASIRAQRELDVSGPPPAPGKPAKG